jgi:hypothetical protein
MDPRDRVRPLLDGATRSASGAAVPLGRIRNDCAEPHGGPVGWLEALEDSDRRGSVVDR